MAISEDTQAIINKLEEVRQAIGSVYNAINTNGTTLHKDNVLALQEELNERGYVKKYNLDKIAADVASKKR